jgi:hypothetical protein
VIYLKKLFKFLVSPIVFFYSFLTHIGYRCYLTLLSFTLYCTYPRLTILEISYLLEEVFYFILLPLRLIVRVFSHKPIYEPVYGTISFSGIHTLANKLHIKHYSVCDIGSGKGKLLFFLSIVHGCRCIGIENYRWYRLIHKLFASFLRLNKKITLLEQDITKNPIPKADVYFISGLGFPVDTLNYIQNQLQPLVSTHIIISVGVIFPKFAPYLKETISIPYSWGFCDTYIYHGIDSTDKD